MSNLQHTLVKSIKWTTISTIINALTVPLLLIAKARFLNPIEFAALAIVEIFIGFFLVLENFGISQAVIQKDKIDIYEASSLFFFNIIFTFFLGLLLFLSSSKISLFFNIFELRYYLELSSVIMIIAAPSLLHKALLEKNFYFKELSIIKIICNFITILVTLFFFYMELGIIAVILGKIFSSLLGTLIIIFINIKIKLCKIYLYFSFHKIIPFFKFGFFVSVKQLMTYSMHHLDELIIGYLLSNEELGVYYFAKKMLEQLRSIITNSFSQVLFPLFSKIKHNSEKLTYGYRKITKYISIFSFPVFIGITITAHIFVPLIFGNKWINSVPYFQIFSISLIFLVLTANVATSLIYSIGNPNIVFYIDVISNFLYIIFLFIFAKKGVMIISLIYFGYIIFKTVTLQYYASKYLLYSFFEYIISFNKVFFALLIMTISVLLIQFFILNKFILLYQLIISMIFGAIVYFIGIFTLEKSTLKELFSAFFKGKIA